MFLCLLGLLFGGVIVCVSVVQGENIHTPLQTVNVKKYIPTKCQMPTNRCQNTMAFSIQVISLLHKLSPLHAEKPSQSPSADRVETSREPFGIDWSMNWQWFALCIPNACHRPPIVHRSHLLSVGNLVRMIAEDTGFQSSYAVHRISWEE